MNDKFKGYLLGAIAAATYGMNPLFALPLYADGMDADSVLLFRYLFAVPMLGAMILVRGRSFKVSGHDALRLVFMGIMVAVSSLALFLSYNYMEAGIASTLLFVYPILVALIMVLFYKERLSLLTAVCIVLAISGIALLYRGGDGTTLSLAGTLLVFLSALTYAIYIVGVNHSSLKDVATLTVTFYVLAFGVTVFLVRILAGDGLSMPTKWYLWGNLLALALFPTAISFLCTTSAIKYIGYANGHTRGIGACHCRCNRHNGVRRRVHAARGRWVGADSDGCVACDCRRQRHTCLAPLPQALPPPAAAID